MDTDETAVIIHNVLQTRHDCTLLLDNIIMCDSILVYTVYIVYTFYTVGVVT